MVQMEGILRIIFEELDHVWLSSMWRASRESRQDMIDIVYMLYLLKIRN
jgi:hypothetical protein